MDPSGLSVVLDMLRFFIPYLIFMVLGCILGYLVKMAALQMRKEAECREGGHQWDCDDENRPDAFLFCKHCGRTLQ